MTTPQASADTIRLWIERSGDVVPLDIEIFLRVVGSEVTFTPRRRRSSLSPSPSPPPWSISFAHNPGISAPYLVSHPPITPAPIPIPPSAHTPIILPPSPAGHPDPWFPHHPPTEHHSTSPSRSSLHWGHIAIYYLAEQMHRWERFIFRFDKQFSSMTALKSISGMLSFCAM